MIRTIVDIWAWARTDRYARWALRLIYLGLLIGTAGTAQLHWYLKHHPLTAAGDLHDPADGAVTTSAVPAPAAPVRRPGAAGVTPSTLVRVTR